MPASASARLAGTWPPRWRSTLAKHRTANAESPARASTSPAASHASPIKPWLLASTGTPASLAPSPPHRPGRRHQPPGARRRRRRTPAGRRRPRGRGPRRRLVRRPGGRRSHRPGPAPPPRGSSTSRRPRDVRAGGPEAARTRAGDRTPPANLREMRGRVRGSTDCACPRPRPPSSAGRRRRRRRGNRPGGPGGPARTAPQRGGQGRRGCERSMTPRRPGPRHPHLGRCRPHR